MTRVRWTIVFLLTIACTAQARAADIAPLRASGEPLKVAPNAYGLGVNADQYGRPHAYRTADDEPLPGIFTDGVRRDAYGLGGHSDEFGRPLIDGEPPE